MEQLPDKILITARRFATNAYAGVFAAGVLILLLLGIIHIDILEQWDGSMFGPFIPIAIMIGVPLSYAIAFAIVSFMTKSSKTVAEINRAAQISVLVSAGIFALLVAATNWSINN
jgi:hypothetical protein